MTLRAALAGLAAAALVPAAGRAQHAAHDMAPPPAGAPLPAVAPAPPAGPPVPADHAADLVYDPAAMQRARATLAQEHGGARFAMVLFDLAEIQPGPGGAAYRWDGQAWFGGDFDRVVVRSEGQGEARGRTEEADAQLLWSHAIAPYFDLQAGLRYDLRPRPGRGDLVAGVEGMAPYEFEIEATAFVSTRGEVSARFKAEHDVRLTQRLILQPRVESNLALQSTRARGLGDGVQDVELGLRLRYEIAREFAPYVGISHERRLGRTADFVRAAGEQARRTRLVVGVRAWL